MKTITKIGAKFQSIKIDLIKSSTSYWNKSKELALFQFEYIKLTLIKK